MTIQFAPNPRYTPAGTDPAAALDALMRALTERVEGAAEAAGCTTAEQYADYAKKQAARC